MFSFGVPSGGSRAYGQREKVQQLIGEGRMVQEQLKAETDDNKKEQLKQKLRDIASELRRLAE
jgi:hypothetical protein